MRRLGCGITHGAERWKTCSLATLGWIAGTNWIADAPVPMLATRSPVTSWPWSQRAEWKILPRKRSRPGTSGMRGSLSGPTPAISTRALTGAPEVWTLQRPASSSHAASVTIVPSRIER